MDDISKKSKEELIKENLDNLEKILQER